MKCVRDIQWRGDRGDGTIFFFVDAETGARISKSLYISIFAGRKEELVSARTDDLGDAKRELKRLRRNRDNAKEGKEPLIAPRVEKLPGAPRSLDGALEALQLCDAMLKAHATELDVFFQRR